LRANSVEKCQAHAETLGHVFFTYNNATRKCGSSNTCFYNTKTRKPTHRHYQKSLQWRSYKSPQSQGRAIRLSSSDFITPDPDYIDEADEDVNGDSTEVFDFDGPLELSNAGPPFPRSGAVLLLSFVMTLKWLA